MPAEVFGPDHAFLQDGQVMSLAELNRIVRQFVRLGVVKVRLTGGEPLLRSDVADLIRILKCDLQVNEVALTTNGWLLAAERPLCAKPDLIASMSAWTASTPELSPG